MRGIGMLVRDERGGAIAEDMILGREVDAILATREGGTAVLLNEKF
jgi:hypothetical protein